MLPNILGYCICREVEAVPDKYHKEEVYLRPLLKSDLQKMATWDQDEELGYFFGLDVDDSGSSYADRCAALLEKPNHRLWAIEVGEIGFIGEVELSQICWRAREAELKICIGDPAYRGRGFGTRALKLTLNIAFTRLKLERVYLRVYHYNTRALQCYLRCGFKKEAVLRNRRRFGGQNRDIYLMYIDCHSFNKERSNFTPIPSIDNRLVSSL